MQNDVVVGAWREGLGDPSVVEDVLKRRASGFRQFPYESTVVELADLLDGYDSFAEELLTEDLKAK